MRPLRSRALPTSLRASPLPHMLTAVYGGYCFTCERRVDAGQDAAHHVVDARTGREVRHVYDPAGWPHLLLLCPGCWHAHDEHLSSYRPEAMRLPYDDYSAAVAPHAEFVYRMTPVVVRMVAGDDVVHESEQSIVVVSGTTEPARHTVEHFGLNGPHFVDGTLTLPVDDRLHRDSRRRARSTAWSTGAYVGDAIVAGEAEPPAGRLATFREMLALAGCWSTAMTAVWARLPEPAVVRALFDSDHGDLWPGTSPAFFDRLQRSDGP